MDIRPIKTEADYDWALAEIAPYFESVPEPGTPQGDRFDVLAELIEAYENKYWPIEAPDPVEAIKSFMETRQLSRMDFAKLIGSQSRASEVLRRKRRLSIDMIHKISVSWHIPADIMVVPYHLSDEAPKKAKASKKLKQSA
jgi:HTH-type transcriptional regulator/antitoxin HigA